jgi:hypothetical protein
LALFYLRLLVYYGFLRYVREKLFCKWAKAFVVGFVVGLPTSLVIIPVVRRIVDRLTMD